LFRSPHRYIWPAELDLIAQSAGFADPTSTSSVSTISMRVIENTQARGSR
jgi:hypothetical protein